jgi:hypothetical protein
VRRRRGGAHEGGHAVEVHMEDAKEEQGPAGALRGNDRARV